jgi:hypothetical protein
MGINVIILLCWRYLLVFWNKQNSKKVAELNITPEEADRRGQVLGARDVTDRHNIFFTCVIQVTVCWTFG